MLFHASCNFLLLRIIKTLVTGLDHASYELYECGWCFVTSAMGTTPTKFKAPFPRGPPSPPSERKKTPLKTFPTSPLQPIPKSGMIVPPPLKLTRDGILGYYGVFLGGGDVEAGCAMSKARYRFSTHRRDEGSVSKVERGLTDARDKTTTLKFNRTLELEMKEGTEHELDNEQFVRTIY
jgi:hypothetical protein